MNILDIAIAKKLAGGGGGSGTDNYNDLSNLPKINDTTLSGNKSSSALGLQSEINSDSKLASDLVDDTNQDNKFVTSTEKNTWNAKQNAIDADHKLSSDLVDDANKTNKFVTSTEKNTWNGKQNAIDSDHKLSSDLVDDANKTNKFVTSTEKNTWNAKQNAIDSDHKLSSDLVDDANHTNKFVTSTEKNTWNAKQNAIDSGHKLSSSLVSFTTAEAAALASGIDSSKVGQISTNQTNILSVQNKVGKNLLNPYTPDVTNYDTGRGITYTNNKDGTWYVAGTSTQNDAYIDLYNSKTVLPWGLKTGDTIKITTNSTKVNIAIIPYTSSGYDSTVVGNASTVGTLTLTSAIKGLLVRFQVETAGTVTNENVIGMVCHEGAWNQNSDIELYGAPNYDLTRLEAEDRAALAEEIDAGAKNKFQITQASTTGYTVNSDGTVTASGALSNSEFNMGNFLTGTLSNLVLSGCSGGSDNTYCLLFQYRISGGNVQAIRQYDDPVVINLTNVTWSALYVEVKSLSAGQTKVFTPMICTKAAYGVSPKFVPHKTDPTKPWSNLASGDNLDNILSAMVAKGVYMMCAVGTNDVLNKPSNGIFYVRTWKGLDAGTAIQICTMLTDNNVGRSYIRTCALNTWSAWKETTNA